jgi:hypothetical protein
MNECMLVVYRCIASGDVAMFLRRVSSRSRLERACPHWHRMRCTGFGYGSCGVHFQATVLEPPATGRLTPVRSTRYSERAPSKQYDSEDPLGDPGARSLLCIRVICQNSATLLPWGGQYGLRLG